MRRHEAFLIIEMMMALAVVSVLSVSIMTRYGGILKTVKGSQCSINRKVVEQAELRYRLDHNGAPSASLAELHKSGYLDREPSCTAGGEYLWASTETPHLGCSVHYWPFEIPSSPATLFASDFDSMDGLTPLAGNWDLDGGELSSINKSRESILTFGSPDWTDYALTLNASLQSGDGYGVYYRANGEAAITGYVFQFDPGYGKGAFLVRKVSDGKESAPIAVVAIPNGYPVYNKSHQVEITVTGDRHVVSIDSVAVMEFTDASFSSGAAGLRTWDKTKAHFDSVAVNPL